MSQNLEILIDVIDYIGKLENATEISIGYIKEQKINEGYKVIAQIAEGLTWVYEAILCTKEQQVETVDISNLKDITTQIVEAMTNGDSGLLADTMEYELLSSLSDWKEQLSKSVRLNE